MTGYLTHVITDDALEIIDECSNNENPFFLSINIKEHLKGYFASVTAMDKNIVVYDEYGPVRMIRNKECNL